MCSNNIFQTLDHTQTKCVYDERMFAPPKENSTAGGGNIMQSQGRGKEQCTNNSKRGHCEEDGTEDHYFEIMNNMNNGDNSTIKNLSTKVPQLMMCSLSQACT